MLEDFLIGFSTPIGPEEPGLPTGCCHGSVYLGITQRDRDLHAANREMESLLFQTREQVTADEARDIVAWPHGCLA